VTSTHILHILFISLCLTLALPSQALEKLPVEAFGSLPDTTQLQLSPSGDKILFVQRMKNSDDLLAIAYDLTTKASTLVARSDNDTYKLSWVRWVNDDQILVSARFPANRWGTPTTETRLLIFDTSEKKPRHKNILNKSFYRDLYAYPQFQDDVIDFLPDDPNAILLAVAREDLLQKNVYRINTKTLKRERIQRSIKDVRTFVTDQQHRVRAAVAFSGTTYEVLVKGTEKKSKWKKLRQFEAFSEEQIWPLGFDLDPNILYVQAYHEGRLAIFKTNLNEADSEFELVFADEYYDVDGGLVYSQKSGKLIGVRHSDGAGYTFWGKQYQVLQKSLEKAFPDVFVKVVSFNKDETKAIVLTSSDTDPGTYYLLDRKSGTADYIASRYQTLLPENMAHKESFIYKARDGLEIEAFLTIPNGYEAKNLPAIVFPHGGPISYDDQGFDYWAQFFANRGYAVFQMNFRGSSGYGYDFMQAGLQNWGKAMQDDVEDGVRELIKQGHVDEDSICIAGASYGGYAALMGAVKTPDLYQCAISFAGVTDVSMLLKHSRNYINYEVAKEQIGSKYKELKAVSPVNYAENIDIPVLLIHGTKDNSVRVDHSRKMKRRLQKAGKSVEYIELKNSGHYLLNNQHRLKTFKAMDRFLEQNLPTAQ